MGSSFAYTAGSAIISGTTATNSILVAPTISVASSTNGDMWYQASGIVARLAKGTGNYGLYMNEGGTAPEWKNNAKYMTISRDITALAGEVSYTGVGFRPSAIIIIGQVGGSPGTGMGTADGCVVNYYTNTFVSTAGYIIGHGNGVTWSIGALLHSIDEDGFTLEWTVVGAPTGTYTWYTFSFR